MTVSTDAIDFTKPIPEGTIIELIARIDKVGTTSCVVRVDIFKEAMYSNQRELAVTGYFKLVALDDAKKPTPIL